MTSQARVLADKGKGRVTETRPYEVTLYPYEPFLRRLSTNLINSTVLS
jgi:hypothetical protein